MNEDRLTEAQITEKLESEERGPEEREPEEREPEVEVETDGPSVNSAAVPAPDDAGTDLDPEQDVTASEEHPRRRFLSGVVSRRTFAAVTLVLVLANTAALVGWIGASAPERARAAVADVSRRFAHALVSFDHRTLDADVRRIESLSTGSFRKELASALGGGEGVFTDALRSAEASSTGNVRQVGVLSVDDATATSFAVVDQSIRNKENPEPRTLTRRLELTLVKTGGGWRVDSVDARE